ncbi:MAG TPA: peptidoglycan-binding protein [Clostridia bacterium]|nr:peptidoglycan-binding protein [Clostridia bacterium]
MKNKIPSFALTLILISSVLFMLTTSVFADIGDKTLKKGMEHPDVALLQEKLNILGYFEDNEYINKFGPKTEAALKAFQKDNGLKPDGIAGNNTFKLLNLKIKQSEILPADFEPLKSGDSGDKVVDIQKKLRNLDIYKTEISSIYDQDTIDAVISFQKANGIDPTGIVDKATLIKLNTASDKVSADRASASRRLITAKVVDYAKQYLGVPYQWGQSSGKAFDCSGFVVYIMKKFNVDLERTASSQYKTGSKVEKEDLQAGDLVFFTTYKKGPSHVGMYIGDNKFIHASSGVDQVTITDLDTRYYRQRYLGARRYNITDNK